MPHHLKFGNIAASEIAKPVWLCYNPARK